MTNIEMFAVEMDRASQTLRNSRLKQIHMVGQLSIVMRIANLRGVRIVLVLSIPNEVDVVCSVSNLDRIVSARSQYHEISMGRIEDRE